MTPSQTADGICGTLINNHSKNIHMTWCFRPKNITPLSVDKVELNEGITPEDRHQHPPDQSTPKLRSPHLHMFQSIQYCTKLHSELEYKNRMYFIFTTL